MNRNISDKDKKDWENFLSEDESLPNKDLETLKNNKITSRLCDLHGYSLDDANEKIKILIPLCYENNILKINVITGKGSRSKNKNDPHKSIDLSILKYSVPEYINQNVELMKKIKLIDFKEVNDVNKGNFSIFLKIKV